MRCSGGSRAYYVDTDTHRVDVFDYDGDAGLTNRTPFIEVAVDDGRPDGLSVDADGCVWLAHNHDGTVRRYTRDGVLDEIHRPPLHHHVTRGHRAR